MRRRRRIGWSLVAALAGAAVGAGVGSTVTRQQVRLLRAQIAQLEQSRARLQANADALGAALREARAPLAWRIHELETALAAAGDAPPPDEPGGAVTALAATASVPSDASTRQGAAEAAPRGAPAEATPAPEPVARRVAPPPPQTTAPPPPPAVSAAPPPAVPTAPPPAERPCRPSAEGEFVLTSPDQAAQGLTGGLVLGIDASASDLVMNLGDGTRHSLVGLPLHVATQCDGLSYIVSICVAEPDPFEVRGVISPAHAWDKPCRALLRARGQGP